MAIYVAVALKIEGELVILIFRPQTVRSGTNHAPGIMKHGPGPRLHQKSVYSHLQGLYSRQND